MTMTPEKQETCRILETTQAELKCLLAVLKLSEENGHAATNKIVRELQVKPPTVCRLLDHLLAMNLIKKEPYVKVELTLTGKQRAVRSRNRVTALQTVVMNQLHIDPESAWQTALFFISNTDENTQRQILSSMQSYEPSTQMTGRSRVI